MIWKFKSLISLALCGSLLLTCAGPKAERQPLVIAMETDIVSLDPHLQDDSVTYTVLNNIYESLATFDTELRITPALAVSWENPDDHTWRFRLRPGVKFHDGRPLTSRDVKYSIERAKKGKAGHFLAQVKEAIAAGDLMVEIHTYKPSPVLLNKLTYIAIVPDGSPLPLETPVGTGAYRFVSYQKGEVLKLEANEDYWAGCPKIKTAAFRFIPATIDRATALLNGGALLAREIQGDPAKRLLAKNNDIMFMGRPGLGVTVLGMNLEKKSPLLAKKAREAIFWALDPNEIIKATQAEAVAASQLVAPYVMGYLKELELERPQVERAKRLLAEAGYGRGFDLILELPDGVPPGLVPAITEQLGRIGIRVDAKYFEWQEFSSRIDNNLAPSFLIAWSCSYGDASDIFEACLHTRDVQRSCGTSNWGRYSNSQLDGLIEACEEIMDTPVRILSLHQAMRLAMTDLPIIPLYVRNRTYGVHKSLIFNPRQDGNIKINEISWAR